VQIFEGKSKLGALRLTMSTTACEQNERAKVRHKTVKHCRSQLQRQKSSPLSDLVRQPLRGRSIVIIQQPTKPLFALYPSILLNCNRCDDQSISQALMVSLEMIVSYEFMDGLSQGVLSEQNHLLQTVFLNCPNEPFRVGI
jgi:hypothetical protein